MNIAAVDPGITGAYAIRYEAHEILIQKNYLPGQEGDPKPMVEDMISLGVRSVVMEDMSGGKATSQVSAINWGRLKQCLLDNGIGVSVVHPSTWKAKLKLRGASSDTEAVRKGRSIALAKELYPNVNLKPTEKQKDSSDFAEALLILHWAITEKNLGK